MLTGNYIFNGNADNALLLEYDPEHEDIFHKGCLICAEQLTNEIALLAIKIQAAGLMTCSSSFATHGANILRSYFDKYHSQFLWITNIVRSEIEGYIGKRISIIDGMVSFPIDEKYDHFIPAVTLNPIKNRTIIDYYVLERKMSVCYWPHRQYDNFTYSIMKKGLEINCEWLFCRKCDIKLDEKGYIWFGAGIPLQTIIDMSRNYKVSEAYLVRQIEVYYKLISEVSSQRTFSKYVELLIEYFSVFILYHNTYEYVLLDIFQWAENEYGAGFAVECVNKFLFCYVDEWMLDQSLVLEKNKSLFSCEPLTPIPDFTIYDDIIRKEREIYNFFKESEKLSFCEKNKDRIDYWIKVFVVKEWKFVINKILFTRCGNKIREICMNYKWPLKEIQNMDIGTVLEIVGDI